MFDELDVYNYYIFEIILTIIWLRHWCSRLILY